MYTRDKRLVLVVTSIAATWGVSFAPRITAEPTADLPHVTSALSAPLRAARDALSAERYTDAIAKLKEAEANPKKTPYDEHIINVLAGPAYARTNNYADAEKAFEAQVNDGFTNDSDLPRIVKAVVQINYHLKNYDRAAEFGNRALDQGAEDNELYTLVSQAYYLNSQYDAVRNFLGKRIASLRMQGRDVPQSYFQLVISSCGKLSDDACVAAYSRNSRRPGAPRGPLLIDPIFKRDAAFQANANSQ
jgi:tetratricopeptide (TPR) repeat protein